MALNNPVEDGQVFCSWDRQRGNNLPTLRSSPVLNVCHIIFTRRYGLLRGPTSSSCGGLQPCAVAFFRAKKRAYHADLAEEKEKMLFS